MAGGFHPRWRHGGRYVAGTWRIRHKLVLGLGLVVGIMAVLLFGSLKGLRSYSATLKSIDSKLAELSKAHDLESAVGDLQPLVDPRNLRQAGQMEKLCKGIDRADAGLTAY